MKIPSDYQEGYKKALQIDRERATNYIAHTTIGDPIADELVDDLSHLDHSLSADLLKTALSADSSRIGRDAPASLKKFMDSCNEVPEWVDFDAMKPGFAMFHRNTRFVLAGMVAGTLVEGFTTNISLSFFIKGRLRYQGIKRLQQNNRHMLEIFYPGDSKNMEMVGLFQSEFGLYTRDLDNYFITPVNGTRMCWEFRSVPHMLDSPSVRFQLDC